MRAQVTELKNRLPMVYIYIAIYLDAIHQAVQVTQQIFQKRKWIVCKKMHADAIRSKNGLSAGQSTGWASRLSWVLKPGSWGGRGVDSELRELELKTATLEAEVGGWLSTGG